MAAVEGAVHEVQYVEPVYDKTFIASQLREPTGAVGACGEHGLVTTGLWIPTKFRHCLYRSLILGKFWKPCLGRT